MSDLVNLRELLGRPMSDFPDLPNLPGQKWFYGKLIGVSAMNSRNKGTPGLHFDIRATDPGRDVTPDEMKNVTTAGFSLADYTIGADFYLTPNSMKILRRFVTSLGFPESTSFIESLALDPETCRPTQATQEKIRGLNVQFRTPLADDRGRVFTNNVDSVAGVTR